jgi:hypothetical protein
MKRDALIKHKEIVIVCKESGLISKNYNGTLTTLKTNTTIKQLLVVSQPSHHWFILVVV